MQFTFRAEESKRYSPWGQVDQSDTLVRGMVFVSTPGHGGLMLTEKFAQKYLSSAAIDRADVIGNGTNKRLCFEEDCAYALVFWELLDKFSDRLYAPGVDLEERRQSLLLTLSSYYPNYLKEVGIEPLTVPT